MMFAAFGGGHYLPIGKQHSSYQYSIRHLRQPVPWGKVPPRWVTMTMGEAGHARTRAAWEIAVPRSLFCCEPNIALKSSLKEPTEASSQSWFWGQLALRPMRHTGWSENLENLCFSVDDEGIHAGEAMDKMPNRPFDSSLWKSGRWEADDGDHGTV